MTECILSGHAGVSKELVVTASDMSKCLVLWRLLLEYINLIILRTFYGKLYACANSVYQAVFFGLGTRLLYCMHCTETRTRDMTRHHRTAREACNFYVNNYKEAESKLARAWRQTILNLVGGSIRDIDPAFWPIKLQHSKEQGSNCT